MNTAPNPLIDSVLKDAYPTLHKVARELAADPDRSALARWIPRVAEEGARYREEQTSKRKRDAAEQVHQAFELASGLVLAFVARH